MGSLHLGTLKYREWRHLTPQEVTLLKGDVPKPPQKLPIKDKKKRVEKPGRKITK
jgi:hypothetical protein